MEKLPTIEVHGKEYVLVKDRILAFHEQFPQGSISTEITINGNFVLAKATVQTGQNEKSPDRTFTGYSEATRGENGITGQSPVEVAETSAVGRALGMLGIGILESVASADEIRKAPSDKTPSERKSSFPASDKQKAFIKKLIAERNRPTPDASWFDTLEMTTAKATIDSLLVAPVATERVLDEDGDEVVNKELAGL